MNYLKSIKTIAKKEPRVDMTVYDCIVEAPEDSLISVVLKNFSKAKKLPNEISITVNTYRSDTTKNNKKYFIAIVKESDCEIRCEDELKYLCTVSNNAGSFIVLYKEEIIKFTAVYP